MSKLLQFFTPREELLGSSVFAKLAHQYSSLHEYLDKIDSEFMDKMQVSVKNIATLTDPAYVDHLRANFQFDELGGSTTVKQAS